VTLNVDWAFPKKLKKLRFLDIGVFWNTHFLQITFELVVIEGLVFFQLVFLIQCYKKDAGQQVLRQTEMFQNLKLNFSNSKFSKNAIFWIFSSNVKKLAQDV
jgi:hypothetical protein